ncbi:DsbA family protein [Phytoactinopolyspora halotolerans]|uniref:Thioredoxin domain-containing protein n=1 Tax=Phytoactinopolyspora halotolerans TaxID=1981512 RepID=A0A6L9S7I6_9ACTN|nr:thioredoxin domain-containing protein [Phytoactinopolyspora halotolerans]NEE00624.1 thioredoxin domain-containing protein [Phytoactinopolyspora halotolerans]
MAISGLVAAGLVGMAVWQASAPGDDVATPTATSSAGDGLSTGSGPVEVEIYLDFLCPACRVFDEAARPMLDAYLAEDEITLTYHTIAILNRASTTEYSTRAAGAAGCAADGGEIDAFVGAMMQRQPAEGGPGLSDDEIVEIGVDVGLTGSDFAECVRDGVYHDWADGATDAAADRGVAGTPTVYVGGTQVTELSLQSLAEAIEAGG